MLPDPVREQRDPARARASICVMSAPTPPPLRQSFDVHVLAVPSPVAIDGRQWLIYELHLTNFTSDRLALQTVDVLDASTGQGLASYSDDPLSAQLAGVALAAVVDRVVEPGQRVILFLEVSLSEGEVPTALDHRIEYRVAGDGGMSHALNVTSAVDVAARAPLGPPLRGGPWAAIYQWDWPRGHRRVFTALDGRARLPARFAIDWVLQDADGAFTHGDPDVVANTFGYGADVLAVANARVAEVRDDVPESDRVSTHPDHPLADAAGNYVALDLGDGRFALYEHLQPGSIRVTPGELVRRGHMLAALGFTGDSTGPHLHFHVADGPSPLLAEGLPYVFEEFRVESGVKPGLRNNERPAPNAVVTF